VHAGGAGPAQGLVDPILDELTTRWKLAEVAPARDGFSLAYLVRLDGAGAEGALMDRLRPGAHGMLRSAELRSLKGIDAGT